MAAMASGGIINGAGDSVAPLAALRAPAHRSNAACIVSYGMAAERQRGSDAYRWRGAGESASRGVTKMSAASAARNISGAAAATVAQQHHQRKMAAIA
jgi:hypothetical protein